MSIRSRILLAVVAVIVLGLFFELEHTPREPVYNDRSLSAWLQQLEAVKNTTGITLIRPEVRPEWIEASNAVRQIGTNGIPTLLQMMVKEDFRLRRKFIRVAGKYNLINANDAVTGWQKSPLLHYMPEYVAHQHATMGFEILGGEASNAVPELIRICEKNPSDNVRMHAIQSLASIGPPARAATPRLITEATNSDFVIRLLALDALGKIHAEPQLVIPVLMSAIKNSSDISSIRRTAAKTLSEYGTAARPAGPELAAAIRQMEEDGKSQPPSTERDYLVRELRRALNTIDPETAIKASADGKSK